MKPCRLARPRRRPLARGKSQHGGRAQDRSFQDHLGSLIGIDMAAVVAPDCGELLRPGLEAGDPRRADCDVGGPELSSRFASVKKGDLAMSAERVFAGTYITEVEVRERALIAWVPEVMRFAVRCAVEAKRTDAEIPRRPLATRLSQA
jgi:ParB family chromosome partitioning protein